MHRENTQREVHRIGREETAREERHGQSHVEISQDLLALALCLRVLRPKLFHLGDKLGG